MKSQYFFEVEPFELYPELDEFETFDTEWDTGEWQEEINRNSPEYARWVQQALNKVMGLRLAVDGKMGPATRSAIRSFQQRQGLVPDGVVGSRTEAALAKFVALPGPVIVAQAVLPAPAAGDIAYNPSQARVHFEQLLISCRWQDAFLNLNGLSMFEMLRALNALSDRQRQELMARRVTFRNRVNMPRIEYALSVVSMRQLPPATPGDLAQTGQVRVAEEFITEVNLRDNAVCLARAEFKRWREGTTTERDPAIRKILQDYWLTGTGQRFTEQQLGDVNFQTQHPWSAAFISWVFRTAGAGPLFRYAPAHATYITWAKDNRLANNDSFFKAYRLTEARPRLGDLVCKSRGQNRATYDTIRPGMLTHCDIVTTVLPGRLLTIGGNVGDSVAMTPVTTDANGFVSQRDYFAVIRLSAQQR